MSSASRYVCGRCGLAVYSWAKGDGTTWKHASGWRAGKSCGKPPQLVERVQYEQFVARIIAGVKAREQQAK